MSISSTFSSVPRLPALREAARHAVKQFISSVQMRLASIHNTPMPQAKSSSCLVIGSPITTPQALMHAQEQLRNTRLDWQTALIGSAVKTADSPSSIKGKRHFSDVGFWVVTDTHDLRICERFQSAIEQQKSLAKEAQALASNARRASMSALDSLV